MVSCIREYMGLALLSLEPRPDQVHNLFSSGARLGQRSLSLLPSNLSISQYFSSKALVASWGPTWNGTPLPLLTEPENTGSGSIPISFLLVLSFLLLLMSFWKPRACPSFLWGSAKRRYQTAPRACLSPSPPSSVQTVDFSTLCKVLCRESFLARSHDLSLGPVSTCSLATKFCSSN